MRHVAQLVQRLDPDVWVYRVLKLSKSKVVSAIGAATFVVLKWASFASSVNNLILQSEPVRWCGEQIASAFTSLLPTIGPAIVFARECLHRWASEWRELVAPIRSILAVLKIIHIPEFLLSVATDASVLIMLPFSAFAVSWITSAGLRAETRRLDTKFRAKIAATTERRHRILHRVPSMADYLQGSPLREDFEKLAEVLRIEGARKIDAALKNNLVELAKSQKEDAKSRGAYKATLLEHARNQLILLQSQSVAQLLALTAPRELKEMYELGRDRGLFLRLNDVLFEEFLEFFPPTAPTEAYLDPNVLRENMHLNHMSLDAKYRVFVAVRTSAIIAITALSLRIIQWIWFK